MADTVRMTRMVDEFTPRVKRCSWCAEPLKWAYEEDAGRLCYLCGPGSTRFNQYGNEIRAKVESLGFVIQSEHYKPIGRGANPGVQFTHGPTPVRPNDASAIAERRGQPMQAPQSYQAPQAPPYYPPQVIEAQEQAPPPVAPIQSGFPAKVPVFTHGPDGNVSEVLHANSHGLSPSEIDAILRNHAEEKAKAQISQSTEPVV